MKRIGKREIWSVVFLGLGSLFLLTSITAYFLSRERTTLDRLIHPELTPAATMVYSRWLDLKTGERLSSARASAWLEMLGYQATASKPNAPGEFMREGSGLTVFVRPFRYPDQDYPAQLIRLEFSGGVLRNIRALAGRAELPTWRFEPRVLAEWDAYAKSSKARVNIEELPPHVPRAILAMEDKRFYDHGAFDWLSIARALWIDLKHRSLKQGASTITQQLARSIFLDVKRTWRRKFFEAILAVYLEIRFSKPELLEMYLNQVYWGQDGTQTLIGLESASQSFFGKPARQLSVAESATLAGMLQSPRRYSPRYSAALSEERKRLVLNLMKDQEFIAEGEYRSALIERVKLAPQRTASHFSYFLAMLRSDLAERYELSALMSQGWKIYTTLDPLLQQGAVAALKTPMGQAGLVVLDPRTGAVRAWVGGTNFQTNPFDHVSEAKRQPGSAFKPFVALAALESKTVTTATLLDDAPIKLEGQDRPWVPQNYDRKFRGLISLWDSLVYSYNVPFVRLAKQIGLDAVMDAARRAGITSPLRRDLSLALGSSEVSLLELTGAYGTLASGGRTTRPYTIEAIFTQDERVIEQAMPDPVQQFEPLAVSLVTQILQEVLQSGTGRASKAMGLVWPAAGKTGTSENYHDAWFVGYTTDLVCGVWVGHDQPKSLGRSAASLALPVWVDFVKRVASYDPPLPFREPEGFTWKTIDPDSGLLAKSGCLKRRKAAFLEGTEPKEDCPLHVGGLKGLLKRWRAGS